MNTYDFTFSITGSVEPGNPMSILDAGLFFLNIKKPITVYDQLGKEVGAITFVEPEKATSGITGFLVLNSTLKEKEQIKQIMKIHLTKSRLSQVYFEYADSLRKEGYSYSDIRSQLIAVGAPEGPILRRLFATEEGDSPNATEEGGSPNAER